MSGLLQNGGGGGGGARTEWKLPLIGVSSQDVQAKGGSRHCTGLRSVVGRLRALPGVGGARGGVVSQLYLQMLFLSSVQPRFRNLKHLSCFLISLSSGFHVGDDFLCI